MQEKNTPQKQPQSAIWEGWEQTAWEMLVEEMQRRHISYKELARRLEALGIEEKPGQLNRKVNRKRFSAAFFLACCEVLEIRSLVRR